MIYVKLKGGLANQIFQWAHGKNLSLKYRMPLYLDTSFYENQIGCTPRQFSLNKFPNLEFKLSNHRGSNFRSIIDDGIFKEIKLDSDQNYILDGYWGSEKYFNESVKDIRKSLSYTDDFIRNVANSKYKDLLEKNCVSIHIRRTDYLNSNGYHPVQDLSYYEKGLDIIGEYDSLYVFSDDMDWCKENITFKNTIFVEGFDDVEDMWLMSICKNNIIANSTFSWWGAWLNKKDGKVIAPLNWFGENLNVSSSDLYKDNWIKV